MKTNLQTLAGLAMAMTIGFGASAQTAKKVVPYQPIKKIGSNGKAYTECTSGERKKSFKGRKICVNKVGEYYFLAD